MMPITAKQAGDHKRDIAAIHAAAAKLGMDTADQNPQSEYRAMLQTHGGSASTTTMSAAGLQRVRAHLRRLGGGAGKKTMTQAEFIALLWSQLGRLEALEDPSPTGLNAFVLKTTRVQTARFLPARDGNRVIEALKAWIAREKAKAKATPQA